VLLLLLLLLVIMQNASTLLGPAADLLSRKHPLWLAQQGLGGQQQQQQQQQQRPSDRAMQQWQRQQQQQQKQQRGLTHVAAVFSTEAAGGLGKAAATAARILEGLPSNLQTGSLSRARVRGFGFWPAASLEGLALDLTTPGFSQYRSRLLTVDMVLGSIQKQQQVIKQQQGLPQQQQQQWIWDLENLLAWWPWLLAAQEELQQAAWQLLVQKILMRPDQVNNLHVYAAICAILLVWPFCAILVT
jgi:hypothetical protein